MDIDFIVANHGSIWTIRAVSLEAIAFAQDCLHVEPWQGVPECFNTDHRPARALVEQLIEEGWRVK